MKSKYKNKNIIGSDETGVGDYLTPLVVAACFVPKENIEYFKNIGIQDSKKISDSKILILFDKIKSHIKSSVRIMSQKQYNFLSKKYNANELKMFLHLKCINSLEQRVDADFVIIDQFSTEKSINKYIQTMKKNEGLKDIKSNMILVEKGEQEHISVAAASIIARAYFLELMKKQNEKWKTTFPLGTNKIVENFTKDFINLHGKDVLYEISKINFKTTKKILSNN